MRAGYNGWCIYTTYRFPSGCPCCCSANGLCPLHTAMQHNHAFHPPHRRGPSLTAAENSHRHRSWLRPPEHWPAARLRPCGLEPEQQTNGAAIACRWTRRRKLGRGGPRPRISWRFCDVDESDSGRGGRQKVSPGARKSISASVSTAAVFRRRRRSAGVVFPCRSPRTMLVLRIIGMLHGQKPLTYEKCVGVVVCRRPPFCGDGKNGYFRFTPGAEKWIVCSSKYSFRVT